MHIYLNKDILHIVICEYSFPKDLLLIVLCHAMVKVYVDRVDSLK